MTPEAMQAFENLKKSPHTSPLLIHAYFSKLFYIRCDASGYGIGAFLFQYDDQQQEFPLAFYSQKLNSCQKNYNVTEE